MRCNFTNGYNVVHNLSEMAVYMSHRLHCFFRIYITIYLVSMINEREPSEGHFLAYNFNMGRSGKGEMRLSKHSCHI